MGQRSLPSILRSVGTSPPAILTKVGNTSRLAVMAAQVEPAGTLSGHQARVGSRTPPSNVDALLPRNGPLSAALVPPLSEVNSTSVLPSSFSSRSVSSTLPTLQSTSSTQSP